tara:strand:- start:8732 stop:9094 length:363 start_codon:yes stop_codon:yes gene_type:complete
VLKIKYTNMETIGLVLIGLCGGVALVMLALAYRSLQEKVNVNDFTINREEIYRNIENAKNEIEQNIDSLRNDLAVEVRAIEHEISKLDSRLDSRVDKVWNELEKQTNDRIDHVERVINSL